MKKPERRGLGRGLSALMSDVTDDNSEAGGGKPEKLVPVERVFPNPNQPRRAFDKEALDDLAASIREKGIIQPLIVREHPNTGGDFEIVAGERRWRAAQMAQLHELPVIIREYTDTEVLEIAIIENIQRADLNPIDEAAGYEQLMVSFGHTQEKLAEVLGKSRSYIANLMRLLQLPADVQQHLSIGAMTIGHARALITSENPSELAKIVVAKGLSVRETERLAKNPTGAKSTSTKSPAPKDADTKALEGDLSANLKMKVKIDHQAQSGSGKLSIKYASLEQLDDICRILSAADLPNR